MGTIAEKLEYTLNAVDDIQLAIENKNDKFINGIYDENDIRISKDKVNGDTINAIRGLIIEDTRGSKFISSLGQSINTLNKNDNEITKNYNKTITANQKIDDTFSAAEIKMTAPTDEGISYSFLFNLPTPKKEILMKNAKFLSSSDPNDFFNIEANKKITEVLKEFWIKIANQYRDSTIILFHYDLGIESSFYTESFIEDSGNYSEEELNHIILLSRAALSYSNNISIQPKNKIIKKGIEKVKITTVYNETIISEKEKEYNEENSNNIELLFENKKDNFLTKNQHNLDIYFTHESEENFFSQKITTNLLLNRIDVAIDEGNLGTLSLDLSEYTNELNKTFYLNHKLSSSLINHLDEIEIEENNNDFLIFLNITPSFKYSEMYKKKYALASYADFINDIAIEGTATEKDVAFGKTFYKDNEYKIGTSLSPILKSNHLYKFGCNPTKTGNNIKASYNTASAFEKLDNIVYFTFNDGLDNEYGLNVYEDLCFLGLEENFSLRIFPYSANSTATTFSIKVGINNTNYSNKPINSYDLVTNIPKENNGFNLRFFLRKALFLDSNVILLFYNYDATATQTSITYMRSITAIPGDDSSSGNKSKLSLSTARTLFPAHNSSFPLNLGSIGTLATKSYEGFLFPNIEGNLGSLGIAYINKNFNASGSETDEVLWQGNLVRSSTSTLSEINFSASSVIKIVPSNNQSLELYNSNTTGFFYKYKHLNSTNATIRGYMKINNNSVSLKANLGTGLVSNKAKTSYGLQLIGKLDDGSFLTQKAIDETGTVIDTKNFYIENFIELNNYSTFYRKYETYNNSQGLEEIREVPPLMIKAPFQSSNWILLNNNILYSPDNYASPLYQIVKNEYEYELIEIGEINTVRTINTVNGSLFKNNFLQIGEYEKVPKKFNI